MVPQIAFEVLTGIRDAASMLTGAIRRRFQAEIATKYCNASPRQTESWFGFNRHAVKRGLLEKESGKTLRNSPERRGRPKVEVKQPQLAQLTDKALSETAQMDPKFQTSMAYLPAVSPLRHFGNRFWPVNHRLRPRHFHQRYRSGQSRAVVE